MSSRNRRLADFVSVDESRAKSLSMAPTTLAAAYSAGNANSDHNSVKVLDHLKGVQTPGANPRYQIRNPQAPFKQ